MSRLCLGMMSYGTPGWPHHPWVLGEAEAQPFLAGALDAGINFFDTADFYSTGASEEILGNFVAANMKRPDAVIATKVCLTIGVVVSPTLNLYLSKYRIHVCSVQA